MAKQPFEVHKSFINKGDKVLIIDDLIATGGTAEAAQSLSRFLQEVLLVLFL